MSKLKKATSKFYDEILRNVEFVSEPNKGLLCVSCQKILCRPKQLCDCGHRIDEACILQYAPAENEPWICPYCQSANERLFPDNSALREILDLKCYCVHKEGGCPWNGALHEVESHLSECEFTGNGACPYVSIGCTVKGSEKDLQKHMSERLYHHSLQFAATVSDCSTRAEKLSDAVKLLVKDTTKAEEKVSHIAHFIDANEPVVHKLLSAVEEHDSKQVSWQIGIAEQLEVVEKSGNTIQLQGYDARLKEVEEQLLAENLTDDILLGATAAPGLLPSVETQGGSAFSASIDAVDLPNSVERVEKASQLSSAMLADLDLKIRLFQSTTFDGVYIWKLDKLEKRFNDAINGTVTELYTPPLHTSPSGYKYSAKVLLYGDPKATVDSHESYVAFYFLLMMGDFDEVLPFPFPYNVRVSLLDVTGRNHITKIIEAEDSVPFQKPIKEMNPAIGFPQFCPHQTLYDGSYVRDDSVFFKIEILKNYFMS